jgi:uncharacterized protein
VKETPALQRLPRLHGKTVNRVTDLQGATEITVAGVAVVVHCDGALYWPDEGVLAIADLHLEKGSSFAARGVLLPPYDTAATLARVARLVARYAPRAVAALGDSFHDGNGPARIAATDRAALAALQRGRDWIWIAGNHDPDRADGIGDRFGGALVVGALRFRHEPTGAEGEIVGHLHPIARVNGRGRTVTRRCFASDGTRPVLPAFGAFAGGLNVRHRAFAEVFSTFDFAAYILGSGRIYALAADRCLAD